MMLLDLLPHDEMLKLTREMAYELLVAHKKSETYVKVLKQFLYMPVAIFGKDIAITHGNEGRNEFIRQLFNYAHQHMNEKNKDTKVKTVKRTRKEVIANE